jgi:hypothetical protein
MNPRHDEAGFSLVSVAIGVFPAHLAVEQVEMVSRFFRCVLVQLLLKPPSTAGKLIGFLAPGSRAAYFRCVWRASTCGLSAIGTKHAKARVETIYGKQEYRNVCSSVVQLSPGRGQ